MRPQHPQLDEAFGEQATAQQLRVHRAIGPPRYVLINPVIRLDGAIRLAPK